LPFFVVGTFKISQQSSCCVTDLKKDWDFEPSTLSSDSKIYLWLRKDEITSCF
jgi:hypothetical protein